MGRPLLTDEMIERANRGETVEALYPIDDEETKIIQLGREPFGYANPQHLDETLHITVEPTVVKSRRIENEKRSLFQAKLNKILAVIILLLLVLLIAMWKL